MKYLLSFTLVALILAGCSSPSEEEDNGLLDIYENDAGDSGNGEDDATPSDEETPHSEGPSEIPDDLVIPE